jgi:hypothetical protein
MKRVHFAAVLILVGLAVLLLTGFDNEEALWPERVGNERAFWSQWGRNPQHTSMVSVSGQPLNHKLADIVYDEFVKQEKAENVPLVGEAALSAHYQSTLIEGDSFYMVKKTGRYISCHPVGNWLFGGPCGPNAWHTIEWNVVRYDWKNGHPVPAWSFWTDWKPEPNATNLNVGAAGLAAWEPVFHPVLSNRYLYVPGAAGTVWKVNKNTGQAVAHITPFSSASINAHNTFVSSPLTADAQGNIIYNVIKLNLHVNPWQNDAAGAWLVKVTPNDVATTVTYATLVPDAPPAQSVDCPGTFHLLFDNGASLPWPPSATAVPPTQLCGSQRPPVNVAPAAAPDGTIYTISFAHFDNLVVYLVAVNPDLTLKWAASLQNRLTDGCGVLLPIAAPGVTDLPSSCRYGTTVGVDPATNANGSGGVLDATSSSPTVLPDGSVIFSALDNYNYSRGHLFHFDDQGNYLNAFTFGWDSTPGVYEHDHTYSIIVKDNHYPGPAYCSFQNPVCTALPPGPYFISQLDANLNIEWSFQNTTIDAQHPSGYEWCVNAPVTDRRGVVYANSEDGHLYSIPQGHKGVFSEPRQRIFLKEALAAAYTPLSIGGDGKVYAQNDGHLFILGR